MFAGEIRRRRVSHMRGFRHWKWHLDEMFVKINGETHYLWRAIDHEGEILESYVTRTRDKKAALAFMNKTLKAFTYDWKGIERRPIPQEWYEFKGRADHARGTGSSNRNATHPVNAILNYAYTVASAQLQIQAMADGFDPSIGLLHETMPGRSAFILDIIEPVRPVIDAKILFRLKYHTLDPADFIIRKDRVCRLSPQFARRVAMVVENILPLQPIAIVQASVTPPSTAALSNTTSLNSTIHRRPATRVNKHQAI